MIVGMLQLIKITIITAAIRESESIKEGREIEKGAEERIKGKATGERIGKKETRKGENGGAISGRISMVRITVTISTIIVKRIRAKVSKRMRVL